ncbi:MAG: RDD family protein [Bacteroidetes bacterium]|nr:RDD family protein [Bacteroidota bacterium]
MESQNIIKPMFWRRFFSALIDLEFVYCAAFLTHLLISQWFYYDFFIGFAFCCVIYYTVCYLFFNGRTLAKSITSLQVVSTGNNKATAKQIVTREVVCIFFLALLLPSYIIHRIHFYTKAQIWSTLAVLIIAAIIMLVMFFILKRPWWELASSTKTIKNREKRGLIRFASFLATAIIFTLTIYIKISYCSDDRNHFWTRNIPEYPVNTETKMYADFIKMHSVNPVDYVFRLFEKYDLVVLDERLHPEVTQYELISKIVGDPRFTEKVGNLYTELISQTYQDSLTHYLNTAFPNEDTLNKATAWLETNTDGLWPIWGNTNLFDFLKFVNKLNTHADDSLKINWYCTDIPMDWTKMTASKYQDLPRKEKRDKIMADRITSIYRDKAAKNEKRRKGLVIMNWMHGYGLIRDRNGIKTGHFFNNHYTTAILMDSLPGKVCNVIINRGPLGLYTTCFGPAQHGKWDKAFDIAGNPDAGFDFENSPFGNDNFDDFLWNSSSELKYKDVFTGFIFYKPLEQHIQKDGFLYMLYNFKDTLLRRSSCISESYKEGNREYISYNNGKTEVRDIPYALYYNLILNVGLPIIIAITLLLCLLAYITTVKPYKYLSDKVEVTNIN